MCRQARPRMPRVYCAYRAALRLAVLGAAVLHAPLLRADQPQATLTFKANSAQDCKPEWPKESLNSGEQGTVTMAFQIGEDGALRAARLVKSSGHRLLDQAALSAISRCPFSPRIVNGKPSVTWIQMEYVWRTPDETGGLH